MCAGFSFLLGMMFLRLLRKNITEEADFSKGHATSLETLPLNLYNTVIQQLKQQKHELQVQSQAEQHRARTSENFSQAVLSNLSVGRFGIWRKWAGKNRESGGQGDPRIRFRDWHERGRYFPRALQQISR